MSRKPTISNSVRMMKPTAAGIGWRIDQAETMSLMDWLPGCSRPRGAPGPRDAQRAAQARATHRPRRDAVGDFQGVASSATLDRDFALLDDAIAHHERVRLAGIGVRPRSPARRRPGCARSRLQPKQSRRCGPERLVGAMRTRLGAARLVDLGGDQPHGLADEKRRQQTRLESAPIEPGRARSGFGFEIDVAILDDVENRFAGACALR